MPDLAAMLGRPFKEQVAAFRLRLGELVPTSRWDDISHEQHERAFMVAGALKADLLTDLAAAVDKAIAAGTGIEAFRKDFSAIVERRGWHGWTGEGTAKGEAWRTRVIYRTNMSVSYAAARFKQLVESRFKYWVYRHGVSLEPRLQHLAWDGLALSPDHPFWETHAPPNGWGCTCFIAGTNSEAGIRRLGGDPAKTLPEGWQKIDPKTGAPLGIGKGWDYAPGASTFLDLVEMTAQKAMSWPADILKAFMASLPPGRAEAVAKVYRALPSLADDLRRWAERVQRERNGAPIGAAVTIEPLRSLGLLAQPAQLPSAIAGAEVVGIDFAIARDDLLRILGTGTQVGRALTSDDIGRLAALLDRAVEVRAAKGSSGDLLDWIIRTESEEWVASFEKRGDRLFLVALQITTRGRG